MFIRAITIGGEYGAGRAELAESLAKRLGWRLVDKSLIEEVVHTAQVEPALAQSLDECIDPWLHRMHKALWYGGYEGVVTTGEAGFDADAMARAARTVIEHAAAEGNCVIVGRGAQCALQQREDVFHVFVYAPFKERVERVRRQSPNEDAEALITEWDQRRAAYIRRHYGQEWTNPHLFDMMVCSSMGLDAAADAVLAAIEHYGK